MPDFFGNDKIPRRGPPVGLNVFLRTRKCGDLEMSKVPTGQHKTEFLLIATEMESFLFNEEKMLPLIRVV